MGSKQHIVRIINFQTNLGLGHTWTRREYDVVYRIGLPLMKRTDQHRVYLEKCENTTRDDYLINAVVSTDGVTD